MQELRLVWAGALALTALIALLRGGRDERWTALALLAADAASRLHHPRDAWAHADLISPLLDALLLAYLFSRAMRTTRWWPRYACAAQVCTVVGTLALWTGDRPILRSYFWFAGLWSFTILLSLALGTLLEQARVREDAINIREACQ